MKYLAQEIARLGFEPKPSVSRIHSPHQGAQLPAAVCSLLTHGQRQGEGWGGG